MILDYILLGVFGLILLAIIYFSFFLFVKKEEMENIFESDNDIKVIRKSRYHLSYMRALSFLNIIYLVSPFLGLLGTVNRILILFKDEKILSQQDQAFQYLVFQLGHALEITVYGIVAAVLSLSLYIYYRNEYNLLWEINEE